MWSGWGLFSKLETSVTKGSYRWLWHVPQWEEPVRTSPASSLKSEMSCVCCCSRHLEAFIVCIEGERDAFQPNRSWSITELTINGGSDTDLYNKVLRFFWGYSYVFLEFFKLYLTFNWKKDPLKSLLSVPLVKEFAPPASAAEIDGTWRVSSATELLQVYVNFLRGKVRLILLDAQACQQDVSWCRLTFPLWGKESLCFQKAKKGHDATEPQAVCWKWWEQRKRSVLTLRKVDSTRKGTVHERTWMLNHGIGEAHSDQLIQWEALLL